MADDLTKPTEEVVLTLIGKDNPKFTPGFWPYVNLGPATVVSGLTTSMTLVGKPGTNLIGSEVTLTYQRIDLGVLDTTDYTPEIIPVGASVYDYSEVLAASIGMNLGADDIENNVVVEAPEEELYNTLQLTAKAGSRGYTGSHVLKVARPPHISTVFTSDILPGF